MIRACTRRTVRRFGTLNGCINCAGVGSAVTTCVQSTVCEHIIQVNTLASTLGGHALCGHMTSILYSYAYDHNIAYTHTHTHTYIHTRNTLAFRNRATHNHSIAVGSVSKDLKPMDPRWWEFVMKINADGTFYSASHCAAAMARLPANESDGQRGVIINVASVAGIEGQKGQVSRRTSCSECHTAHVSAQWSPTVHRQCLQNAAERVEVRVRCSDCCCCCGGAWFVRDAENQGCLYS